ncbi:hypothetical protein D3C80_1179540 [compost metagenome]
MCRVQGGICRQARRQVWVGDEWHAERHGVGFAAGQRGIGTGLVKTLVDDVGAAERLLDQWADAVVGVFLPRADEGDAALAQFTGDVGEGLGPVGVAHVV